MNIKAEPQYWLLKTEPSEFSIDDLMKRSRETWNGVRNYQARNYIRAMRKGDLVFIYHSSIKEPAVVGMGKVVNTAFPDPSQFDVKSPYFDRKSKRDKPQWFAVDVAYGSKFESPISLSYVKKHTILSHMVVAKKGNRLSIQPVSLEHAKLLQVIAQS